MTVVRRSWEVVLLWLRVLWVCRIAALSVGFGFLLFSWAEPARDLFMEAGSGGRYWSVFFLSVFAWALILHYSGRKVVQQQAWAAQGGLPLAPALLAALRAKYALPATVIPRLLGLACFAAVGVGIWRAGDDLRAVSAAIGGSFHDPADKLFPWLCVSGIVYLIYVVARRGFVGGTGRSWRLFLHDSAIGKNASLLIEPRLLWFVDLLTRRGRRRRPGKLQWDYLAVLLLAGQIGGWLLIVSFPLPFASYFPRALFVVLMLAAPVSLLAFLSAASHQIRFPVPSAIIATCLVLTGLTPSFHDLRLLPTESDIADQRQDLRMALDDWAALNCPDTPLEDCTQTPVIVATAGGASRAAFFTATVVGDLLDHSPDFSKRLFAFSGVSGGSVGAVMITAAMSQASAPSAVPCDQKKNDWLWFRHDSSPEKWRDCLQSLTAGDFLSPAFIGLAFRDLFGFLRLPHFDDRAALLEKAIEARFDLVIGEAAALQKSGGVQTGDAVIQPGPLERPLGRIPGTRDWRPLVFLNATSVETGRRVIASDILPAYQNGDRIFRLFPEAFDLFDMLRVADSAHCQGRCYRQVRLSTAGVASARFPVISPQGIVRGDSDAVDAVVDGGYFENDGLTTARELAEAIHTIAGNLQPIIIEITNDPAPDANEQDCGPAPAHGLPPNEVQAVVFGNEIAADKAGAPKPDQEQPSRPLASEPGHGNDGRLCNPKSKITWHDGLTGPFKALQDTRGGHAAEAYLHAENDAHLHILSFFKFQVYRSVPSLDDGETGSEKILPLTENCSLAGSSHSTGKERIDDISMSWWLSDAVQAYLDRQLCQDGNRSQYGDLQKCLAARDPQSRAYACLPKPGARNPKTATQ
ncbi:hypothetical protein NKH33_30050 [Mesorhizobium sp. M1182]|uniref:hypothetical protein n=1 Tax=Mesorhizobium sp. M1182 TaxID=2957067 RepID=UPI0033377386